MNGKELTLMCYVGKLNKDPGVMIEEDVLAVRCEGASDEELLEVTQFCVYFRFLIKPSTHSASALKEMRLGIIRNKFSFILSHSIFPILILWGMQNQKRLQ